MYLELFSPKGVRKWYPYARYLVEHSLGTRLDVALSVHHINGDFTDDRLENLTVLDKRVHASLHAMQQVEEIFMFTCPVCSAVAEKQMRSVRHNWKQGKAGPFCSRACAGKYSQTHRASN